MFIMDNRQRKIYEFSTKLSQSKSASTGAKTRGMSKIIIIDCSDDSDSRETDIVEQTTCKSISDGTPVRRHEGEAKIQLVPQVSAEQSEVQIEGPNSQAYSLSSSNVVGTLEVSVSSTRGAVVDDVTEGVTACSMSDNSQSCECVGCSNLIIPNQPSDVSQSKFVQSHLSKERQPGQKKQYCRTIQTSWYKKYPWITVCTSRYKIFCRVCCLAKLHGLVSTSLLKNSSFISEALVTGTRPLKDLTCMKEVECTVKQQNGFIRGHPVSTLAVS